MLCARILIVISVLQAVIAQLRVPVKSLGRDNPNFNASSAANETANYRITTWQTLVRDSFGINHTYVLGASSTLTSKCVGIATTKFDVPNPGNPNFVPQAGKHDNSTVCSDSVYEIGNAFDHNETSYYRSGVHYRPDGSFFGANSAIDVCKTTAMSFGMYMTNKRQLSFTTSTSTGFSLAGDWIEISFPAPVILDSYAFVPHPDHPRDSPAVWAVFGNTGDGKYHQIHYVKSWATTNNAPDYYYNFTTPPPTARPTVVANDPTPIPTAKPTLTTPTTQPTVLQYSFQSPFTAYDLPADSNLNLGGLSNGWTTDPSARIYALNLASNDIAQKPKFFALLSILYIP